MTDLTKYFDDPGSDETIEWLVDTFKKHIIDGGSMDDLLELKMVGYNAPSARTLYFKNKRQDAIVSAWDILCLDNPDQSDWWCSGELIKKLHDKRKQGDLVSEIRLCNKMLGDSYGSVDALHKVACRSKTARVELIASLLDT